VGSPITFSGFNQIDFNLVLSSIMTQASQPLVALQNRQAALQSQISTYDSLNSKVLALRTAADRLGSAESVSTLAATSSDEAALGASASNDAAPGIFEVVVNELARAQVTASTSSAPDANTTVVAGGGTLTIGGVTVTVAGNVTLQGLADTINDTDGIGVRAAVVRTAPGAYRLVLSGNLTGVANGFTVTNGLTGGTGVAFGGNAVEASDASLLVNDIPVTGSSNTFTDVVTGLTLTARQKDPAAVIRVEVAPDSSSLKTKVEDFITAYNDLVKFANDQRAAAAKGDAASIGREPMMRQLRNSLRSELLGPHGAEVVTRLAEVGVELTSSGTLELNESRFDEAIASNGEAVREMFAGTGGVFPSIEHVLDEYSTAAGFIPSAKDRLTKQITSMDGQIAAMQSRLALQRETLQREFTAADQAMTRLKNQSASLSNIGGSLGSIF